MKRLLAVLSAWKLATVVLWARYCRSEVPPLTDRFRCLRPVRHNLRLVNSGPQAAIRCALQSKIPRQVWLSLHPVKARTGSAYGFASSTITSFRRKKGTVHGGS
jgi:hypothetical protein